MRAEGRGLFGDRQAATGERGALALRTDPEAAGGVRGASESSRGPAKGLHQGVTCDSGLKKTGRGVTAPPKRF